MQIRATNTPILMPDLLHQALATPGLVWLILTMVVAGLVRGFSGFGTGMIFAPIGYVFLPAADVILLLALTGFVSSGALLPRAVKEAELKEVSILGLGALVMAPLGVWLLTIFDQVTIRWGASAVAMAMVSALLLGWRYRGAITTPRLVGIGGTAGVFGGLLGLPGPAVILFYLASGARAAIVRANTIVFLAMLDVVLAINLTLGGFLNWEVIGLVIVLSIPYFAATRLGQRLFKPGYEQTYRLAAYGIIAAAVVIGLPLWDQG